MTGSVDSMREVPMNRFIISTGSTADDLIPVGMALHEMLNRLPITARSKQKPGVRIESGTIVDREYTGPVLEQVLEENKVLKVTRSLAHIRVFPLWLVRSVTAPVMLSSLSGSLISREYLILQRLWSTRRSSSSRYAERIPAHSRPNRSMQKGNENVRRGIQSP